MPASAGDAWQNKVFNRVATYIVCENTSCDREQVELTSAEIVAATEDGNTLLYTDSPAGKLGFVDISDPAAPHGLGTVDVGGEPTSVAVAGACPDQRHAAIAIENERDEDVTVGGVEGGLPQPPPGFVQIVVLGGDPADWRLRKVDMTGLPGYAPSDPEPEFVAINRRNQAAVSLQENNVIAIIDLNTGRITSRFNAGKVALENIDAVENSLIDLIYDFSALADDGDGPKRLPREPDGLDWSTADRLVTANEGDLFGGTRGFTVFDPKGQIQFDAAEGVEYATVRVGQFPEARADAKGSEPEGIETARFKHRLIFVALERANLVLVYRDGSEPALLQALPTGIGPEGLLALPERGLFIAAAEDDESVRSQINIFALEDGPATYPQIVSRNDADGLPIAWGALSGLSGDAYDPATVYTVHDSYYVQSRIYQVDVSHAPAEIVDDIELKKHGASVDYDLEGIAQRADKGFWLVSEGGGNAGDEDATPNLLIKALPDGRVVAEVELPAATNALQRSNVTDNDGVDDSTGETLFLRLGQRDDLGG